MLAQICAILLFYGHLTVKEFLPWCVLQLYERNKLKLKYKKTLFESKLPLFWELLEFPYNAVPDRTVLPHGESFYPRNAMLARVQLWP